MFCTNCGTEFEGNFCPKCGQAAQEPSSSKHEYYDRDGEWIDLSVILGAYRDKQGVIRFFKRCTNYTNEEVNNIAEYVINEITPQEFTDREAWEFKAEVEQEFANKPRTRNGELCCPECGSTSLSSNKKGFSFGKAAAGMLAVGGLGLLAGGIGSKKVEITCLICGHRWKI